MKIPKDNWRGNETLEYEIPWMSAQAIIKLDELLTKDMSVLEFGSGGSTLFFSRRVKSVVSFESKGNWFKGITQILKNKGINNVEMILFKNLKDLENKLYGDRMRGRGFHCVMIDNAVDRTRVKREVALEKSLPLLIFPKIIVLDNWASPRHYPNCCMLHDREFVKRFSLYKGSCVEVICVDHYRYGAKGTRIFYEGRNESAG